MFTFRGGFGWGIGGVLGKVAGIVLVIVLICIGLYFLIPKIASAIVWIIAVVAYVVWIGALAWFGWHAEGRLRRRRLVLAGVLAIWGVMWINNTTITRVPSETSSTSR